MKLFNRQKSDQGAAKPPTVEELLGQEAVEGRRVDWRRTIPRALVTLIVIAIIAAGTLWAFGVFDGDNSSDRDKKNPGQTAQNDDRGFTGNSGSENAPQSSDSKNSDSSSSGNSTQSGSQPSSGTNSTTGTPSGSTTGNSAANSGELAASGPAETVAVFAIAVVAGATLYQVKLRRQN